jgi:hypothetical protein
MQDCLNFNAIKFFCVSSEELQVIINNHLYICKTTIHNQDVFASYIQAGHSNQIPLQRRIALYRCIKNKFTGILKFEMGGTLLFLGEIGTLPLVLSAGEACR